MRPGYYAAKFIKDFRRIKDCPYIAGGFINSVEITDTLYESGFSGITTSSQSYGDTSQKLRKEKNVTKSILIELKTIEKVMGFVNDIMVIDGKFNLISDRYIVNAKSIMGIFSLDLSKPLELKINAENEQQLTMLDKYAAECKNGYR